METGLGMELLGNQGAARVAGPHHATRRQSEAVRVPWSDRGCVELLTR